MAFIARSPVQKIFSSRWLHPGVFQCYNVSVKQTKGEKQMNVRQVNESDWKLFRSRLPGWQEACMERLVEEYVSLLAGPGKAYDKFWELDKRIREDQKQVGVAAHMSRSYMYQNILALLIDGVITLDDLEGFTDGLRELMAFLMKSRTDA
jgi:hypothetical protein